MGINSLANKQTKHALFTPAENYRAKLLWGIAEAEKKSAE